VVDESELLQEKSEPRHDKPNPIKASPVRSMRETFASQRDSRAGRPSASFPLDTIALLSNEVPLISAKNRLRQFSLLFSPH